jgi:DNA-binding NtrC family response regulator
MSDEKTPTGTVLVVDDEALIRWSLSEALADAGYAVKEASTGAETVVALEGLGQHPLTAIVLDLRLPDVADLSLVRRVRETAPQVPLILMSAHASNDDVRQALSAGVFRFVEKPFDVAHVVSLVGQAIEGAEHP